MAAHSHTSRPSTVSSSASVQSSKISHGDFENARNDLISIFESPN